jgi:membrane protein YdbS with pleckstrin-like domain
MAETVRLRPPRNQLDPRVTAWWRSQIALRAAAPTAALGAAGAVASPVFYVLAAAALTLGVVYGVVMPAWWYRVHRWEVTDTAVYASSGWFWQEWRVAPMSRIQTVDTKRGPLQQLFGLSSVIVTTASAAGAITIAAIRTTPTVCNPITTATTTMIGVFCQSSGT